MISKITVTIGLKRVYGLDLYTVRVNGTLAHTCWSIEQARSYKTAILQSIGG